MNNGLNNMLNEFLKNTKAKTKEELDKELAQFIEKYNNGNIAYEPTALDEAYEILEQAECASTAKQAIELAKKAYAHSNECFDAILFQVDLEENVLKRAKMLEEGLEIEKSNLINKGYFDKENIGHFYGIFKTRQYMRGLYLKATNLLEDGKIKLARDVCKEILRLNINDNLGARYYLMAIYAFLEEEKEMLSLYKKYPEENLEMLFPLLILYYKLGNDEKAKEYLNRINQNNKYFIKWFKGTLKKELNGLEGYYQIGTASEVMMYFTNYDFLIQTVITIGDFILEHSKKTTKDSQK